MKLSQIKKPLNEQSFAYQRGGIQGFHTISFFGTRTSDIPSLVIMSLDNKSLPETENFALITVKPRVAFGVATRKDEQTGDQYTALSARDALINFATGSIAPESLEYMLIHPDIFKIREIHGKGKMYVFLTTTLGMTNSTYVRNFGERPEVTEGFVEVHGAKLFFPDAMRPKRKEEFVTVFRSLHRLFYSHRLLNLITGDVRFSKLKNAAHGQTTGLYYPNYDEIRIHPVAKADVALMTTLIHEHGHRWWFKYSNEASRDMIKEQYITLRRNQTTHIDNSGRKENGEDLYRQVQIGMTVHYTGRKRTFKSMSPFFVLDKDDGKIKLSTRDGRIIGGGAIGFMNSDWTFEGVTVKGMSEEDRHPYGKDTDQWFPTAYSMEDYEEWFSELFAFYILDHLNGEPKEFIEQVLRA